MRQTKFKNHAAVGRNLSQAEGSWLQLRKNAAIRPAQRGLTEARSAAGTPATRTAGRLLAQLPDSRRCCTPCLPRKKRSEARHASQQQNQAALQPGGRLLAAAPLLGSGRVELICVIEKQ